MGTSLLPWRSWEETPWLWFRRTGAWRGPRGLLPGQDF